MNRLGGLIILSTMLVLTGVQVGVAADNAAVVDAAKKEISKRSAVSGTLDLFDEKLNKVRNLQVIEVKNDVAGDTVMVDTRDTGSGDAVTVAIKVKDQTGALAVESVTMDKITENKVDPNKTYTDAEVQDVMKKYLETQAKFTGHLMLYDEKNKKMRNLDLVKLDPEVRRLGILYISHADFKDVEAAQTLGIDVTVENQAGQLKIQSLRIRDVK